MTAAALKQTRTLLLGKDGQVGWELQRTLAPLGEVISVGRADIDIEQCDLLRRLIREIKPSVIVNAAAYTAVDKAESEIDRARRINAEAVGVVADEAKKLSAWVVHYSTDYVFDGKKADPYVEDDLTAPLSAYGTTKLEGEHALRRSHAAHLIFRTSWVYSARGANFAKTILRLAKEREELRIVADQHGTPTSAALIADVTALVLQRISIDCAAASLAGTYHLVPRGDTTWYEYAQVLLRLASESGASLKATPERVLPIPTEAYPLPAVRPKNSRMNTRKLQAVFNLRLPDWRYHLARMVDELSLRQRYDT